MISIIIYEDDKEMQILYQKIVYQFFSSRKRKIKFHIFSSYVRDLENQFNKIAGKKIFILDIEVPGKSGLDLARLIRNNGDWMSPLIVITNYEYLRNTGFTSKILMLDFIAKCENVEERLQECLETSYDILHLGDCYTFQYNGELFHIPFSDILYFEKDMYDNYTFIYTEIGSYKIKENITQIEKKLIYHPNFLKVHRSCIVNLNQITSFHRKEKRIYFRNCFTDLVSRENVEILMNSLNSMQIMK